MHSNQTLYRRVEHGRRVSYQPCGYEVYSLSPGLWLIHSPEKSVTRYLCLDRAGDLPDPLPLAQFTLLLPDIEAAVRRCMDRWRGGELMSAMSFVDEILAAVRERLSEGGISGDEEQEAQAPGIRAASGDGNAHP